METKIIDGKQIAKEIRIELKKETKRLMAEGYPQPKLTVILVGNDPASETYVRNKIKACEKVGVESQQILMDASVSEETLLAEIRKLNEDPSVNGILVQLPLPKHISVDAVIEAIDPAKDVDGFHIQNVGSLTVGDGKGYVPCTPGGVIELLKRSDIPIDGKQCVVVGRSNLVGKPEEMVRAIDMGDYYRIPCDTRDLNYDKFFTQGNEDISRIEDYHSHNTRRLDVEGMKQLLLKLRFVREDLGLIAKQRAKEIRSE